jgi:hypothetical protein
MWDPEARVTLKLFERALLLANLILEELESQSESPGYSQTLLDCCVNSILLLNPTQLAPALALLSLAKGRIFYISQPEAEPIYVTLFGDHAIPRFLQNVGSVRDLHHFYRFTESGEAETSDSKEPESRSE